MVINWGYGGSRMKKLLILLLLLNTSIGIFAQFIPGVVASSHRIVKEESGEPGEPPEFLMTDSYTFTWLKAEQDLLTFDGVEITDAIDAGIDVGLDYKGLAPDLGPFEYDPGAQQSSAKNIISFTLPQQTGPAIINTGNYTVSIEVAHGTNVSSLTPTISVSAGATINPASGVARNFNTSQTYVVTAEDASTQTWTVTVTVASEEPSEGKWVPVMKNGEFVIRNNRIVVKYIEDGN